ncbi:Uncharacterised protein [Mycobacterium tuberculosis]|nr:Uncharacterised protein [Mycobacterium tuberculosis]COY51156.1 Uncharacterised protein [Mycobacterium tuberculosis]
MQLAASAPLSRVVRWHWGRAVVSSAAATASATSSQRGVGGWALDLCKTRTAPSRIPHCANVVAFGRAGAPRADSW